MPLKRRSIIRDGHASIPTRGIARGIKRGSIKRTQGSPIAPSALPKSPIRTSRIATQGKVASRKAKVSSALSRVQKAYSSGKIKAGSSYDPDEAAALIKSVGGSDEEARALSTKVTGESGGNPRAVGDDAAAGYGNTYGLGLWQMTTGVGNDDLINKYGGRKAMLKPKPNARAALELYRGGGIGNWYAPSNAPGDPDKAEVVPKHKPSRKDLKTLAKAGVDPQKKAKDEPKRRPGQWAGSQKAVLNLVPKSVRAEGRGDKRTPEENASVGGATNSDHLTTNEKSYAADLPADDATAQTIAKRLGMGSHTGTNQVVKDGYQYTLIWQDAGHYDHIHIGAEWVGKGVPPGTTLGGSSGSSGGSSSGGSTSSGGSSSGGTSTSGGTDKKDKGAGARERLSRVRSAYPGATSSRTTSPVPAALRRRYGRVV